MLMIRLRQKGGGPAYRQIAEQIRGLIESGAVKEGDILPPTRTLASRLAVSRYTVCLAYQELWAQGYVSSRPGSYSRVLGTRSTKPGGPPQPSVIGWSAAATPGVESLCRWEQDFDATRHPRKLDGVIDFSTYDFDPDMFPMRELQRCLRRVSDPAHASLLHYGDAQGYRPLREYIAGKLASHSIRVEPDEILVTSGSLHALDLVFKTLAGDGGRILAEVPAFRPLLSECRVYGVQPVCVPLRDDGMDIRILERRLGEGDYRFLYTIPSFHNPTGITTSQAKRERILELCTARGLPIAEDAFEEEITYVGKLEMPIKSMDRGGVVLSLGTFSKVLFPGLRVGWVAADSECIRRLLAVRRASDESGSMLVQAAMAELCLAGYYERHLKKVNAAYAERMKAALGALRHYVDPRKARWTEPGGGFLIWMTLSRACRSESQICAAMEAERVWALPGSGCYPRKTVEVCLRLSISSLGPAKIVEGVKRLARALDKIPS